MKKIQKSYRNYWIDFGKNKKSMRLACLISFLSKKITSCIKILTTY